MFRSKGKLSIGMRNKSSSLLTLNEIDSIEKSTEWRKKYTVRPKEIGRGHFSKVYHVFCEDRKKSFAAKVIRRRKGGIDRLEKIKQEAALIRRLNELGVQSVIQLFETYENFSDVVLISELAKGGCLFKLVQESDCGLRPDYVKVVAYKLLLALEAMHAENIVHLDIKADNILLREPYPSTDIALCDFGLATQLKEGKGHKELVGTPDYMAPEVINYEKVTVNADMWSVGVLVYYLLTAVSPFMGKSKDETLVNVSKVQISFDGIFNEVEYADAKDFISSLCRKCPESRLSSTTSQKHPWFANVINTEPDLLTQHFTVNCRANYGFQEDDLFTEVVNPLSRSQRWQSVDFRTIDMSSNLGQPNSFKPLSFLTMSCENIFSECADNEQKDAAVTNSESHRNLPCTLTNVEEVNDEAASEPCSSDLVDVQSYNANNNVPLTPLDSLIVDAPSSNANNNVPLTPLNDLLVYAQSSNANNNVPLTPLDSLLVDAPSSNANNNVPLTPLNDLLVDAPSSNANNNVPLTPLNDLLVALLPDCNCPLGDPQASSPCAIKHIRTSIGNVRLMEFSFDGRYSKRASIISDPSTSDPRSSDCYLEIQKFEDTSGTKVTVQENMSTDSSECDCPSSPLFPRDFVNPCSMF